jgi:hypothetical protein
VLLRFVSRVSMATLLAGGAGLFLVVPAAEAAYPGANGHIAFSSTRDDNVAIYQVDPNRRGQGYSNMGQLLRLTNGGAVRATVPVELRSRKSKGHPENKMGHAPPKISHPKTKGASSGYPGPTASQLTEGGADVEPFYSPDGKTVYFSSDRDDAGFWAIYSIAANQPESHRHSASELSAVPGQEADNDYAPSVAPDDSTVVFNRDDSEIATLWAPAGPSSVCTLYTPPEGLAPAEADGSASRAVFDPVDPSKLVFVGADGDLHLLSGIKFTAGTNPCNETGLTDTNLSTEVFPAGSRYAVGRDANPDWSPNGQQIVFNSTRGGGDTLFVIDLTTATPTGYPIWPSLAARGKVQSTEPVFSPDGTELSFVQPQRGTRIFDEMLVKAENGSWQGDSSAENLTEGYRGGVGFDSEPDWQPVLGSAPGSPGSPPGSPGSPPGSPGSPGWPGAPPVLPESPSTVALPVAGAAAIGLAVWVRGRRGRRLRRRAAQ